MRCLCRASAHFSIESHSVIQLYQLRLSILSAQYHTWSSKYEGRDHVLPIVCLAKFFFFFGFSFWLFLEAIALRALALSDYSSNGRYIGLLSFRWYRV